MWMQLVDANDTDINHNASIVESYDSQPTNTCTSQQIPAATSCAPTGDGGTGRFIDTLTVAIPPCGSGIPQSSSCGFTLTATWSACGGGHSNQLWQSWRITQANSVWVDGSTATYNPGTILH